VAFEWQFPCVDKLVGFEVTFCDELLRTVRVITNERTLPGLKWLLLRFISYMDTHVGLEITGFAEFPHAVLERAKELVFCQIPSTPDLFRAEGFQIVNTHIVKCRQELISDLNFVSFWRLATFWILSVHQIVDISVVL